jgi:hypothetical protein
MSVNITKTFNKNYTHHFEMINFSEHVYMTYNLKHASVLPPTCTNNISNKAAYLTMSQTIFLKIQLKKNVLRYLEK